MTVTDQIHALIARVNPPAQAVNGAWPIGCPYEIRTLADGGRRLLITCADGDVRSGNGPTVADAVRDLTGKLK
jgi:hypothetical protein